MCSVVTGACFTLCEKEGVTHLQRNIMALSSFFPLFLTIGRPVLICPLCLRQRQTLRMFHEGIDFDFYFCFAVGGLTAPLLHPSFLGFLNRLIPHGVMGRVHMTCQNDTTQSWKSLVSIFITTTFDINICLDFMSSPADNDEEYQLVIKKTNKRNSLSSHICRRYVEQKSTHTDRREKVFVKKILELFCVWPCFANTCCLEIYSIFEH